jgi:hypothetical protein
MRQGKGGLEGVEGREGLVNREGWEGVIGGGVSRSEGGEAQGRELVAHALASRELASGVSSVFASVFASSSLFFFWPAERSRNWCVSSVCVFVSFTFVTSGVPCAFASVFQGTAQLQLRAFGCCMRTM